MKKFFKPTKGGSLQRRAAFRQGMEQNMQRLRAKYGAGKGATRPTGGNLMQPHQTPLSQPIAGQYGAGVGQNQQPNIM